MHQLQSAPLPNRTPAHPPTQRAPVNSLGSVIHPVTSILPPNTSQIGFSIFLCIHDTRTLMKLPSPLDSSSLTWSPCITPVLERSEEERRVTGFCLLCDHNFTYVTTDPFTPESDCGRGDGCPVSCNASLPGGVLSFLLCFAPVTPWSPNPLRVAAGV